jgi:hypothetical protein
MKYLSLFSFILITRLLTAQNNYLIEYDRIHNTEKYYQQFYEKGNFKSKELKKKPILKKGDVVKIKSTNVNPFVFQFGSENTAVKNPTKINTGAALSGFSEIMRETDGAFSAVSSNLNQLENTNEVPSFKTRGATSKKTASYAKVNLCETHLVSAFNILKNYEKSIECIKSTELTKEQILEKLKLNLSGFNKEEYFSLLRLINEEYDEIKSDSLLDKNDFSSITNSYEDLSKKIENTIASPKNTEDLISNVENAEFTYEKTEIIGIYGGNRFDEYFDKTGYVDFNIEFSQVDESKSNNSNNQDEFFNTNNENELIIQNHIVNVPVETQGNLTWSSGLFLVSPFKGFTDYKLKKLKNTSYFNAPDTSEIVKINGLPSIKYTLGTSLMYNFQSKGIFIPQAIFGISISISDDNAYNYKYPMNFLLGGGLKLKSFPFLSLSAGVSFCENRKLANGYAEGNKLYGNSTPEYDEFTKRVFSPGYFLAININL